MESVISITRSILIDGFYASQASFEEETDIQKLVYTETLTDLHEIMQRAFTEIEKAISLAEQEVNIYYLRSLPIISKNFCGRGNILCHSRRKSKYILAHGERCYHFQHRA